MLAWCVEWWVGKKRGRQTRKEMEVVSSREDHVPKCLPCRKDDSLLPRSCLTPTRLTNTKYSMNSAICVKPAKFLSENRVNSLGGSQETTSRLKILFTLVFGEQEDSVQDNCDGGQHTRIE